MSRESAYPLVRGFLLSLLIVFGFFGSAAIVSEQPFVAGVIVMLGFGVFACRKLHQITQLQREILQVLKEQRSTEDESQ